MRLLPVDVRRPRLAALTALLTVAVAAPAAADVLGAPQPGGPEAGTTTALNPEFSWAPVARAGKYRLQVATTGTFDQIQYSAEVQSLAAVPPGELPLGDLFWRVAALDGSGAVGSFSPARAFTRSQPGAPAVSGPADGANLTYPTEPPVLSWAAVPGMKQYRVQLDDEPTFTGATEYTTAGTAYSPAGVVPAAVPRYWRVQGVSTAAGVTTAWSTARTFTIGWPSTAKPALLGPADTLATAADDLRFSWSPVSGAAAYELQTSTNLDFTASVVSQTTYATAYRPTETPGADDYYWRVRAVAAGGGTAPWSDVRSVKRAWLDAGVSARPSVTVPDADPVTAGIQQRANEIRIDWSAVPRATHYELEVSTDTGFGSTDLLQRQKCITPHTSWTPYLSGDYTGTAGFSPCAMTGTPTTTPSTRFIVANPAATYYVRVRAVDKTPSGATVYSLWSNETRSGEGAGPGETGFKVVADDRTASSAAAAAVPADTPSGADTPRLSWQPVTGAVAYRVAMARDDNFTSRVTPAGTYFVTPNTDLVLNEALLDNTAGTAYYWFAIPCSRWDGVGDPDNICSVGDAQAINVAGRFESFTKVGRAVAGLAAEAVQGDTISLAWDEQLATSPDGGGVSWYELQLTDGSGTALPTVRTDATGYSPVLKSYADGPYTWRVRAIDSTGTALAWSAPAAFTKRSSVPAPLASAPSGGLPVLRWTPTAFAGAYDVEVYRGSDAAFPAGNRVLNATGTSARPYVALTPTATLTAGTYSWRVRQVDLGGSPGPWSTAVPTFTVGLETPQVTAPAAGAAVPVADLVLRWDAVPGAVRYRVESATTAAFTTLVDNTTTVATAFAPTVAHSGGTTYHWRVSALDADDHVLSRSADRSFVAQTAPLTPGAAKAAVSGSGVAVSWTAPDDGGSALTGYVVRYRPFGSDGAWSELVTAADVASRTLPDLPPGQKYEAQVAALNALGTGPFSAVVSATTPTVPAVPGALKATGKAGAIGLTWSAPANGGTAITGYVVRGGGKETTVPSTSATLDGLTDGKSYGVEVAAVNAVGTGPFASTTGTAGAGAGAGGGSTGAPKASTLTLGGPAKIVFGRSTTLTGVLAAGTASLTGLTVTVESRPAGSSAAWAKGPVVKTEAKGAFTAIVTPTAGTEYRATFAGSPAATASTAKAIAVAVAPKLVLKAGLVRVRARRPVTLTGVATPKLKGLAVRVSCVKGKLPVTAKSTKTTTGGRFKVVLRPGIRGRVTCKAKSTAKSGLAAGTSAAAIVNVF